jgi:Flp pilus assembly pilin Flp
LYQSVLRSTPDPRADAGQALVEYSLILLFVALVSITLLSSIGDAVVSLLEPVLAAF